MIAWLRSAAFALVFYALTVPVVLIAPVVALTGHEPLVRYVVMWARLHRFLARHLLGITSRVEGQSVSSPALYAAKHQSMYETLELVLLLDAPAIVLKRELAAIPVWGWVARRYGCIAVDRDASAIALRSLLREAEAARAAGRSILIFPEGTRVAPGEQPPLRSGFAGLYRALGLPCVPIALDSGRVWPRRGSKRPGQVTFRLAEPIAAGLSRREAEAIVHAAINALD